MVEKFAGASWINQRASSKKIQWKLGLLSPINWTFFNCETYSRRWSCHFQKTKNWIIHGSLTYIVFDEAFFSHHFKNTKPISNTALFVFICNTYRHFFFYNGCRYSRARAIVNEVKADKNNQHVIYIATLSNPHYFAEKILSWKTIANFWTMDRDDFPNFRSLNLATFLKMSFITYRFYTIHICTWVNTR